MKNRLQLLLMVSVFLGSFIGILGCDKLNLSVFKKAGTKISLQPSVIIAPRGPIVAKVNNIAIGLDDLNEDVAIYNANIPEDRPDLKIVTLDQKINYLRNEIVRRTLLYQHALDNGLDRAEEVQQAIEKNRRDFMVLQDIKNITKDISVSSKEVEDYYNVYKEQLKEPEERQLAEIVVNSEQEAKDILIQLLQGEDFATLARSSSKVISAKDGGSLGFIQKGKKSAQFDAVAFSDSLEVGKVSSIFKTPEGYSIVKLEAKRGGKQKSLSEMWDEINRGLIFIKQQQALEDLISKLSRDAKIEVIQGEIK